MMFGAGALVLLIRKSSDWSDWATFAALLIPALVLFALALAPRLRAGVQGWPSAYLVFGTLLLLAALLQLVNAAGGTPRASLNIAWTFGVTGALAFATSIALQVRVQMLVGAVLWLVAWLAIWDKILTNPSGDTVRWLLLVIAAIYVVLAIALTRSRRADGSDLITVAGIGAVLAGALSFAGAATATSQLGSLSGSVPKPGQGWNVFLLVVSLLLIGYGSRAGTRGPGYVGAVGLISFIALTGADLVSRLNGEPGGGVVGWPLILLLGGAAGIALSFVLRPGSLGGAGGAAPPGAYGPPGAARPGAYGSPGATQPGAPTLAQPGAAPQPPPPPGAPPAQPGSPLDQWRQQPPPGPGTPPQQ
jgi:hypothetical protein